MDFLKYLDVVIGLALVMVLISPVVTSCTQILMWLRNRRSVFLLQMLERLLVQIGGPRAVLIETRPAAPTITLDPLGTTDANGRIWLPDGVPETSIFGGVVTITARNGGGVIPGQQIAARFIPQDSPDDIRLTTDPSQNGVAQRAHSHAGSRALASTQADFLVLPAAPAPVTTVTLKWSVNGSPEASLKVTAGTPLRVALPPLPDDSIVFAFAFTLLDTSGNPVTGESVQIDLARNAKGDHVETPPASAADGSIPLAVPRGMDPSLAMAVTQAIVKHPLLRRRPAVWMPPPIPRLPPLKNRDAEVVEREELIRVLLELAAGEGEGAANLSSTNRELLKKVLVFNGITDPVKALATVRTFAQQLERDDPSKPAHERQAKAILKGAESALVGKITQWFDAAAARATQQYAAEARATTIVAALLVAFALQFDTLGLLRRLSTDPELRNGLVQEARTQQERIDKLSAGNASPTAPAPAAGAPATQNDLALALAKRDEIEKNLATLRAPAFSILPDHFVWERLSKARLDRNPAWTSPYPANLTLIAGGATHTIPMHWRRDVLTDIAAAIEASGAPVDTEIVSGDPDVLIRSSEPLDLRITQDGKDIAMPQYELAQAVLEVNDDAWPDSGFEKVPLQLSLDDVQHPIVFSASRDAVLPRLAQEIAKVTAGVSVACYARNGRAAECENQECAAGLVRTAGTPICQTPAAAAAAAAKQKASAEQKGQETTTPPPIEAAVLAITAKDPQVKEIRLLWKEGDPFSNVLNDTERVARFWRVRLAATPATPATPAGNATPAKPASNATPTPVAPVAVRVDQAFVRLTTPVPFRQFSIEAPVQPRLTAAGFVTGFSHWQQAPVTANRLWLALSILMLPTQLPPGFPFPVDPAVEATTFDARQLVITSKRRGPLELRYAAGKPETNVLNAHRELAWGPLLGDATLAGVLLSWVLLSLGAPFWYDALKNLLKLRPPAAAVEERNRNDRAVEGSAAGKK